MARTIKTTTEDFRPNEFIDLVESVEEPKTFIVENKNGVESRVIENNIERVNIQNIIEEGRYEVSRELKEFDNSENKPTNVSSKYEPILFSETLLSLRKTGVLRAIENEIEKVKINFKDGDVKIFFNQQNLESDVLDIFNNSENPQNQNNNLFAGKTGAIISDHNAAQNFDIIPEELKVNISLKASWHFGKGYEAGHIAGFHYNISNLPDNAELINNLTLLLEIYEKIENIIDNQSIDMFYDKIIKHQKYLLHQIYAMHFLLQ